MKGAGFEGTGPLPEMSLAGYRMDLIWGLR